MRGNWFKDNNLSGITALILMVFIVIGGAVIPVNITSKMNDKALSSSLQPAFDNCVTGYVNTQYLRRPLLPAQPSQEQEKKLKDTVDKAGETCNLNIKVSGASRILSQLLLLALALFGLTKTAGDICKERFSKKSKNWITLHKYQISCFLFSFLNIPILLYGLGGLYGENSLSTAVVTVMFAGGLFGAYLAVLISMALVSLLNDDPEEEDHSPETVKQEVATDKQLEVQRSTPVTVGSKSA